MQKDKWNQIEKVIQETLGCASMRSLSSLYPGGSTPLSYRADINVSNNLLKGSKHEISPDIRMIHYTGLQSLFEILNSKKLRLYNAATMNDPMEMYSMLRDFEFFTPELLENKTKNVFLIALCEYNQSDENRESFSMWRNYSQNGLGVGIVFKLANYDLENRWIDCALGKVSYEKKGSSQNNIQDFFQKLEELKQKEKIIIDEIPNIVFQLAALHKNEIWSEEKEVRLFKFLNWDENEWLYESKRNYDYPEKIKASINSNTIQYFIELDLDNSLRLDEAKKVKEAIDKSKYKVGKGVTSEEAFDIYPSLVIDKIIFGYGLARDFKNNVFDNLRKLIEQQFGYGVEFEDSIFTDFFQKPNRITER